MIPKFEKRYKNGEDACYANDQLLVVLDGVGGWSDVGIDAGLFTKQLIKLIETEYESDSESELVHLLEKSLSQTTNPGTSTVVMLRMDQNRPDIMKSLNIGDSGFTIFRPELNDSG